MRASRSSTSTEAAPARKKKFTVIGERKANFLNDKTGPWCHGGVIKETTVPRCTLRPHVNTPEIEHLH